jgi:ribosomal protein S18 acetylase RimI-like enzyme
MVPVIIREMLPGEAGEVGALRVAAYRAGGFLSSGTGYEQTLRALGLDGGGTVLVAAPGEDGRGGDGAGGDGAGDGDGDGGSLLGTVMLQPWHAASELARGPGEAEVRALAVAPGAQGRGTGRALMLAVIEAAAASGADRLLLCTQPEMAAAQRLYRALGFLRSPGLDRAPAPGVTLLGFELPLRAAGQAGQSRVSRRSG